MFLARERYLEDRLTAWQAAGIVDADTAARIRGFESHSGAPRFAGMLTILGAFALVLGLSALVAANWQAIPVIVKLGGHMAVNLVLGLMAWVWPDGRRREGAILLLSGSTLALAAHIGQSFQLQGGAAGLLLGWLVLTTPFTLALARSGFNRWIWSIGLAVTVVSALGQWSVALESKLLIGTVPAMVVVALRAGAGFGARMGLDEGWAAHLGRTAMVALMTLVSLTTTVWSWDRILDDLSFGAILGAMIALVGLAAATEWPERAAWEERAMLLLSAAVAAIPAILGGPANTWLAAGLFGVYWAGIAAFALRRGSPGLYRLSVFLIAGKLFLLFVSAYGGLLASGFGLMLAGLVLIGLALAAGRIMGWARRLATGEA